MIENVGKTDDDDGEVVMDLMFTTPEHRVAGLAVGLL